MTAPEVHPAAGDGKAIHATKQYLKFGEGSSRNFNFSKHVAIAMTAGLGLGLVWKTWHWNAKRNIATYYSELARKEIKEEAARKATVEAKFKQLELELSQ